MKIKCVSGPVFVDGAMMFTGQVRDVAESIARTMVAEHPHSLQVVGFVEALPVSGATDVRESVEPSQPVAGRRSGKGRSH